ncbi:hypothetical protein AUJ84_01890 [Candidatus Pacearchaeota archaeon CG1_02_32_132]|nr:MAG: hypothetical protein AUJ84_01890 [Candidatus Pacearchaeota archaeon CG1_02_32_132]
MNIITSSIDAIVDLVLGVPRPEYHRTNEDLLAIVTGLDIREGDDVLAVAGSGDQSFAMLERGAKVTAVDYSREQFRFMKKRVKFLLEGDRRRFLLAGENRHLGVRPGDYFSEELVERIIENINNLKILCPGDFLQTLASFPKGSFNKVYLSNIYSMQSLSFDVLSESVRYVRSQGLIYQALPVHKDTPNVDLELINRARELESKNKFTNFNWKPTVIRVP